MKENAEAYGRAKVAEENDPRVTRVGNFLRKTRLDELPQFWAVLRGEMSLVGPRPPLQYEFDRFTEWQKRKLSVKPGMTSLWQVKGKPQDFDEWVRLDLEYIERGHFGSISKYFFRRRWSS